jgi:aminoglycoside phosphotransferase (APT) family kinase protein
MADAHALDLGRLVPWLRVNVPGAQGEIMVEKFPGGQSNPTYAVAVDGVRRFVLRKKPPGVLLPSAHAVEREYRITRALADTDVPVARPLALCEDPEVVGTPFFVMTYAAGRNFWDPRLPGQTAAERAAIYDEMNRVIAAIHGVDPAAAGVDDFGPPGDYFARQAKRWTKQYRASETQPIEAMERLIEWLPANNPGRTARRIVHGDFRNDNMIFAGDAPRVLAVIDWELSTIGDPLADLAGHMMIWRLAPGDHRGLVGEDLTALGIPDEASYLRRYAERTGGAPPGAAEWRYALALAFFRDAAIRQGIVRRALDGNASNPQALAFGERASAIAGLAWRIAQGDTDATLG